MNEHDVRQHLSGDRLHILIATILGLAFAVYAGLFAVGYGGNPVKSLMLMLGAGSMVVASLRPRIGLGLLVVASAYLDFIKRLLVCFGASSMSDVTGVLAVAPMILAGIFLGTCVLHPIFTKKMLDRGERRLVLGALMVIGVAAVVAFRDAVWIGDFFGNVANQAAYALLVPIVYILYRRRSIGEIRGFLRFVTYVYIPVAAYGVYQFWFGYNQFEIDYLQSGLTSITNALYDSHPRPFSTLNSPHGYSVLMWFMAVLALHLGFDKSSGRHKPRWLPFVYVGGVLFSFVRGAILLSTANIFMSRWFKTRKGTMLFYGFSVTAFVLLVAFSQSLVDNLQYMEKSLPMGKQWQQQAFRLGTISERLFGYQGVLLNPRMYTLFGHGSSYAALQLTSGEEGYNHDSLSTILFRFGIVGLLVTIVSATYVMYRVSALVWQTKDPDRKALGSTLVSMFTLIVLSHVGGPSYNVFPINLFMWLFLGFAATVCAPPEGKVGHSDKESGNTMENQRRPSPSLRRGKRLAPGSSAASNGTA
ncbi:MAG: hypothetical protein ABIP20_01035 [Chthoniobacteraceae bacterium]